MDHYSLYLFKSEYAHHFYYKIDTIYRFLYEQMILPQHESNDQYKHVLDQIEAKDLFVHLKYWVSQGVYLHHRRNQIIIKKDSHEILIKVEPYVMNISVESIVDMDNLLFQYIKTFHPHIYAVNFDTNECGWITPFVGKEIYSL